jgi:DNA-binding MarR family transcriptional regulator
VTKSILQVAERGLLAVEKPTEHARLARIVESNVTHKRTLVSGGKRKKSADRTVEHSARGPRLDESLGYLVRRTHHAFVARLEERLASYGISSSTWSFLRRLWDEDGLTQKELADALGLTPPTAVSAIDNLEESGLVQRRLNGTDRRKRHIFLTDKARQLVSDLRHHATEVNDMALEDLTPTQARVLAELLHKVLDALHRKP